MNIYNFHILHAKYTFCLVSFGFNAKQSDKNSKILLIDINFKKMCQVRSRKIP